MDIVATYLRDLRDIRSSGSAVKETSFYPALSTLLNAVGAELRPRVRCVLTLKNRGAGIPDGGLFTADQIGRHAPSDAFPAPLPARGVLEVKGAGDDVTTIARSPQVQKYLDGYGQVLVTNYRDFVLVGRDAHGRPLPQERYRLAANEAEFWAQVADPVAFAATHRERLVEYLKRVLLAAAPLTSPADVAWFLASYARDARMRVEHSQLPALRQVRKALEEALGISFNEQRGDHFFRSTLIQTLFYGVFSAWVLWHHEDPERSDSFDWRLAQYYLHVPVLQALFSQISTPQRLRPLGLMEVLDWTGAALNRVERGAFFARFDTGHAVQYFYEPFLEAFDPELRKDLGVWYTPPEVVRYMVARVDAALRDELGVADGLADPSVIVLDPCTGTGAYVAEVLRQIAATLRARGEDALLGQDVKRAALSRVFGFELLPAPFVVAHLQIGLLLQQLGAPLADDERVGVYLTNALTGWEPPDDPKQAVQLRFPGLPELQDERDQAEQIKRGAPILVILGNPPYSGYAGIARIEEERDLSHAYRTTKRAPAPQGQGLNDLYVRFFRMAERQIVETSRRGVVCYISNYSWLDGLSFTGMRERYLEVFDRIWIDSLNGDKYRTGKLTPDGQPDPSVFSTDFNREGIQVGTAIALMVRRGPQPKEAAIAFRNFWGREKRTELDTAATQPDTTTAYQLLDPPAPLGFPFQPAQVQADYLGWPLLPKLFPVSSPGVNTSRDADLVAIDREVLEAKLNMYFDPSRSNDSLLTMLPSIMRSSARYNAAQTRQELLPLGKNSGFIVRYTYQPFDTRFVYWHPKTKLLDEKRPDLFAAAQAGNKFLIARQKAERQNEGTPFFTVNNLADRHLTRPGSDCFPLKMQGWGAKQHSFLDDVHDEAERSNLSAQAIQYLADLGIAHPHASDLLWMHALAIGYSKEYLVANADALRQDWPRIPLPATSAALLASAELGRQIAALLDSERPVPGVTSGAPRDELRPIGILSIIGGGQINPSAGDLDLTAGWGYAGRGGITMPGKGRVVERAANEGEVNPALGSAAGGTTLDIYLNDRVYWRNIPPTIWAYTIGGYQVLKKWLSYRERPLLGRSLSIDEAREVRDIARRIAAILLLEPALDANYRVVTEATHGWK
ncbi:type ISP restriction/modification enzyme [Candidatus Chloroploca asiatica]|uniref:site-specific DNA-methyltransferase (adenine-specific) n=1 Tax=Candidatus Chloroploca asiatica TaxID=1506545 RepID=A0A2H3KGE3_9CHLR|nr:type ISP restriction/modification enzyme [Candidatus Chloroploca asiatica]PDV96769.1 DNA methyltransferase [Candidatus Chloroploca asiatica]